MWEQAFDWLDKFGILWTAIQVPLLVFAWVKRKELLRRLAQTLGVSGAGDVCNVDEVPAVDVLVFTVSSDVPPMNLIRQLTPRRVGLLFTERSTEAAKAIKAACAEIVPKVAVSERLRKNPENVSDASRLTAELLREVGGSRPGVDVTGGMTPTSLGAFHAAVDAGATVLYQALLPGQKPGLRAKSRVKVIWQRAVG